MIIFKRVSLPGNRQQFLAPSFSEKAVPINCAVWYLNAFQCASNSDRFRHCSRRIYAKEENLNEIAVCISCGRSIGVRRFAYNFSLLYHGSHTPLGVCLWIVRSVQMPRFYARIINFVRIRTEVSCAVFYVPVVRFYAASLPRFLNRNGCLHF